MRRSHDPEPRPKRQPPWREHRQSGREPSSALPSRPSPSLALLSAPARAEQLFLLPSQQLLVPDDALVELLLGEFSRERLAGGDSGDRRTGRVSFDACCAALTSMYDRWRIVPSPDPSPEASRKGCSKSRRVIRHGMILDRPMDAPFAPPSVRGGCIRFPPPSRPSQQTAQPQPCASGSCTSRNSDRAPRPLGRRGRVPKNVCRRVEIPQSAERGARGDPEGSFDGALEAAQDVCRVTAGIRKHELRRANPAFRERTGRPARRPRRRSRR